MWRRSQSRFRAMLNYRLLKDTIRSSIVCERVALLAMLLRHIRHRDGKVEVKMGVRLCSSGRAAKTLMNRILHAAILL